MKQQLWIWSSTNQWWNNGYTIISQEIIETVPWETIRVSAYRYFDTVLCTYKFEVPSHRDLRERLAPPWKPKTPQEVIDILDGKK